MATCGENIKQYRKLKGLKQSELGELVGVKGNAVSAWETGQNSIDVVTLGRVAKALDVSLLALYGGEIEESPDINGMIKSIMANPKQEKLIFASQDLSCEKMDMLLTIVEGLKM